jgi:tyrosine-specific transport protein
MNTAVQTIESDFSSVHWMKILNALFLVTGTCIGGGMLVLPIASSLAGFWPSVTIMFIACAFMTLSGLLFLEATLWMKEGSHIMSLSRDLLNKFGQIVCWVVYLFISYASLIGDASGGGKAVSFILTDIFHIPFSNPLGSACFLLILIGVMYTCSRSLDRVNVVLFTGVIAAFVCILMLAPQEVNLHALKKQNWGVNNLFFVMPLMLTTFSFPGIVPTIVPYLKRDVKSIRIAIIGGASLTFVIYFLWLLIVLGTVPHEGTAGLQEAFLSDVPATECLHYAIKNSTLCYLIHFFAFFSLTTSFLGISLTLFDFLSDGFGISKKGAGKLILNLLIAAPTLFFAVYFQRAFITALELSGGVGDTIISGFIPAIMVWNGRYRLSKQGDYQVMGGKPLLICGCLFSLFILVCEIIKRTAL